MGNACSSKGDVSPPGRKLSALDILTAEKLKEYIAKNRVEAAKSLNQIVMKFPAVRLYCAPRIKPLHVSRIFAIVAVHLSLSSFEVPRSSSSGCFAQLQRPTARNSPTFLGLAEPQITLLEFFVLLSTWQASVVASHSRVAIYL